MNILPQKIVFFLWFVFPEKSLVSFFFLLEDELLLVFLLLIECLEESREDDLLKKR